MANVNLRSINPYRLANVPVIGKKKIRNVFQLNDIHKIGDKGGMIKLRKGLTRKSTAAKIGAKIRDLSFLGITGKGINISQLNNSLAMCGIKDNEKIKYTWY